MKVTGIILLLVVACFYCLSGTDGLSQPQDDPTQSSGKQEPFCTARKTRGFFGDLWNVGASALGLATNAVSTVVNAAGSAIGWVFAGPWAVIVPGAMNKAAIRAACGASFDLSKENLAGKVAGLAGTLVGSVWSMVVPNSVNQGSIAAAQTMGQTDECIPVNGTTYPIDFTDAIRMSYSTVEDRDRLLQAVASAWSTIVQPYDPVGISIFYVSGVISGSNPCTIDVTYRITGLTRKKFEWIVERPNFLNFFKTSPPPNMWAIPDLPTPGKPQATDLALPAGASNASPNPAQTVLQPTFPDAQVQAPGCSPLTSTSKVYQNNDNDISVLRTNLNFASSTIDELVRKGFKRVSDLSVIRQIDLPVVISLPRDRYLLREAMFCLAAETGQSASNGNHFLCQYYSDLTTRCWNDYRPKTDADTKYDKALNVVGTGNRIDGTWSNANGIFVAGAVTGAASQIGSCTFELSASCAYVPPTTCAANTACGPSTNFAIASYVGQPGGSISAGGSSASGAAPAPAVAKNTHFFCQYWTDLTTRCWGDYRAKQPDDTKYDQALNVVGTGSRVDGVWGNSNGVFNIAAKDVSVDWDTPKQYGSCTFSGTTASCSYMPPAGCTAGSACPGQTTFGLTNYNGQPGGTITGSRGDINIAV